MKRMLTYLFIEIILLGFVCYFLVKWNQPIQNSWLDTTYNTIGFVLLIFPIINFVCAYISFSKYTNKYPKNEPTEFAFDPQNSQLGYQGNGNYLIEVREEKKGVWIISNEQLKMKFDMRGYICPKRYICTYFIRNIHYGVINKNKYPLIKLFKSLELYPYAKYQNFDIHFIYDNKIYKRKIIVNNKSKITWSMSLIMRSKYYVDFIFGLSVGEIRKNYVKMNEEKYRNADHR